jgi:PAS domain S-box-containing protein
MSLVAGSAKMHTPVKHYFIAASSVVLVAAIKTPIEAAVGTGSPLIFFVPVVTFAAWLGGLGPGLLAVGLSTALCCYSYFPPVGSFRVDGTNDRFQLLLFWLQGAMTCVLSEHLRAARRRAESYRDSLGRSEEQVRALMDNAPAVIYIKDAEGRYLMANRHCEALFGTEDRPVVGRTDLDIFPLDLAEKYRSDDREVLASGRPLQCEDTGRLPDGQHIYLTIKFPLRDSSGRCYALAGFSTDITERKRFEEAFRESEGRLRSVTDTARVGLVVVDEDHRYLYANRAYAEILGISREDIVGLKVADVLAPVYEKQIRPRLDRAFAGERVTYELRVPTREGMPGDTRSFAVAYEPQLDGSGARRVVVVIVDVSEQRRAEESFKEHEGRLGLFIEHAPAAIAMFDQEMRYIAVSRRWMSDYGLGEQGLIGRSHYDIFPEVPERWKDIHRRALSGEVIVAEEDRFDRGNDIVLWLRWEVRPWRNAVGEIGGIVVATEDITERKRAEVVNSRLAAIVDWSDDAVVGKDLNGVITSWNAAAGRLFGYAADEAVGSSVALIIPQDRLGEEAEILDKMRHGIPVDHYETVRRCKGGRLLDVSLTVSPIRDGSGRVVGASKIARDITERKRAEAALRDYSNRLKDLSRRLIQAEEDERRRIARELHDEIGQAMTALKINLQAVMKGGADSSARLEESLTIVGQALEQVRGMALELRPPLLDDLGLVAALDWYVGRHAQRTGLSGRFVADPDDIRVDPEIATACFRIAQEALTNVARHSRATRFSVELLQYSGGLQLVVRDDGMGFDSGAAMRASSRGSSLGLIGMQERVELVSGRIAFASEPGGGTEVQVDFP